MATSSCTDLKLVNVVNALENLTLDQTKNLALQLGVKLNVLIDIECEQKGESRRAHYIQVWLDIDTEASWEKIIAALNQIGMKVVAAQVTSQYLPKPQELIPSSQSSDPTPLSVPVASYQGSTQDSTPDLTPPQVQAPESGVAQLSLPTTQPPPDKATPKPITPEVDPKSPPDVPPQPLTPEVDPEKVAKAKATIEHLEDSFSDVMSDTCEELCEKESNDPKFFNKFRTKLLLLPVAKKRIHIKFFRESEDEIIDAKNVRKLLAILSRYCDYRNYEVLLHLVNKFCEVTKSSMMKYCSEIESFELTTTVDIYLVATSASAELSLVFSKMVVKMNKKASSCLLRDIRKFNEALSERASLAPHSVYIQAIGPGSVVVELRFPRSAVGWVLAAMTPDFLYTHNLIEVTVDGEPLTTIERDQYRLDKELRVAARSGDVVRVASLLNSGADIETMNLNTPLMDAASLGHITTLQLLLDRGAIVDGKSEDGDSALMLAANHGQTDAVVELMKGGTDIDMQNKNGNSALIVAAIHGETDIVVELIKEGADINMQNKIDHLSSQYGNTALILASGQCGTEAVVELVKAGADVNLQNDDGDSALMTAARWGNTDNVVELMKEGADIHMQNKDQETALMLAAEFGRTKVVVELAKAGADLNLRDKGNSALMGALSNEDYLFEGFPNSYQPPPPQKADLEAAAIKLIEAGSNLDIQNEDGDTAVILATVHYKPNALQELVRAGADLNVQNNEGLTALMISMRSRMGHVVMDILLSGENIDLDIQENSTGWSALFFAAENGNVWALQCVLQAGANAYLKDKSGLTVLEFATAFCEETKDRDHRHHGKHWGLLQVCEVLSNHIEESAGHHDMSSDDHDEHTSRDMREDQKNISSVEQDPSTGVQDTSPTADQGTSRKDQDTPRDQDTSLTDPSTPPASQVTTPPTTTVTQVIRNRWNSMRQRANNLLQKIDGRLRSAKKKAEREEKLLIMDDNQQREKEQAELRELEQAAATERKRRRGRVRDNRSSANTAVTFNIT